MADRRYSDEQVAAILGRAAELSASTTSESAAAAAKSGLTLPDIEDIARQAGIDPAVLARAAADVERGVAGGANGDHSVTIEGELDDAGREAVFAAAMKVLGPGATASNPSPRTMRFVVGPGNMGREIVVTTDGGVTRVVVRDPAQLRYGSWLAGGLFAAFFLPMAFITPDPIGGIILGVGGAAGALAAGFGLGKLLRRSRAKFLDAAFGAVKDAVMQNAKPVAATPATTPASDSALEEARARQGLADALPATAGVAEEVVVDVAATKK